MRRLASHILVASLLLTGLIEAPAIAPASAAPVVTPTPPPRILAYSTPVELPRASVSQRSRPPLPQPVPVDPNATPLPGPTQPDLGPGPPRPSPGRWPVAGSITTWYSASHPAVDIAAPCGTPVVAPVSGQITFASWRNNGGGFVLELDTAIGLVSLNHLSGFAVTSGWVDAGTVVAYVGATGWATGCHVHWAIWRDGYWRNPLVP